MFNTENMAIMFFRKDCQAITANWSKEDKLNLAKQMSKITMEDGRFFIGNTETIWKFSSVPDREFTSLKIYSWMQELVKSTHGYDVNPEVSKMIEVFG